MRFLATLFFVAALFAPSAAQDRVSDITRFRESRDKGFRDPVFSPLDGEQRLKFTGLVYYAIDEKFAVRATLDKTTDEQVFMLPASTGPARKYFRYGLLTFELDGVKHSLIVFRSETSAKNGGSLFLPFKDPTNADETYSGGRYLDLKVPAGNEVEIDFNLAYSPSCAFSDSFACAIPPKENFLKVAIKAGEKRYAPVTGTKSETPNKKLR